MRTILPLALLISACETESGLSYVKDYGGIYESTLSGRACDADSGRWLEGAVVYTHIVNDADELIDTRETYTAADGTWLLEELRGGQTYTVYVQYGNDIVDMFDIVVPDNAEIEAPTPACGADLGRVAVITGSYDDWEAVLPDLGVTNYELINGLTGDELGQFLSDPANLSEFGALFFAGGHIEEDVLVDADGNSPGRVAAVIESVRGYVTGGGFVYASDWSYDVVELCWPDKIDFLGEDTEHDAAQLGVPDTVRASISVPAMADAVGGDSMDVSFDLDTWPIVERVSEGVTVYQRASEVTYREGTQEYSSEDAPLLVGFDVEGGGRVVFSSWRSAANMDGRGPAVMRFVFGGE